MVRVGSSGRAGVLDLLSIAVVVDSTGNQQYNGFKLADGRDLAGLGAGKEGAGFGMFKPQRLGFEELSERLHSYERKYGYSTIEFYRRYERGELGDDDDLMMWAGLYHLYLTSLPIRQFMKREPVPA